MSRDPHPSLTASKPQTLMMLVTSTVSHGIKHTPLPGAREAEEHLGGASVASVWLLSHVDKINQQVSSSVHGALPRPSERKMGRWLLLHFTFPVLCKMSTGAHTNLEIFGEGHSGNRFRLAKSTQYKSAALGH